MRRILLIVLLSLSLRGACSFAQLRSPVVPLIDPNWRQVLEGEDRFTDAELRTWKGDVRLDYIVNVKDYGATGDGSTDDTAAFEAARDAAGTGTVFIPAGTYLFESAVDPGDNITWRGVGQASILKCSATNADHAIFESTTGIRFVVFEDLAFRSDDPTAIAIECVDTQYLDTTTFRRLDFYPEFAVGISGMFAMNIVENCRFGYLGTMPATDWICVRDSGSGVAQSLTTTFDTCWFYNANATAAVVLGKGNTRVFRNCIWEGCNSPAIYATGAWGIYLDRCNFEVMDPSASSDAAITEASLIYLLYDAGSGQPSHVFANGCYFTNNAGSRGGTNWETIAYTVASGTSGLYINNSHGALGGSYLCEDSLGAYDTAQVWYQGLFEARNNTFTGYLGDAVGYTRSTQLRIHAPDPAIIFQPRSAVDTRYWMGVTEDADGVDDDLFEVGTGTTKGSNVKMSLSGGALTSNVPLAVKNGATSAGYVDLYEDSDNGSNYIRLQGPASTDTDTLILPTAAEIAEAGYLYCAADGTITTDTPASYTNLTSFVDQTAWRIFYSNTDGDVTELALGADGTYLKSNGAAAAPTWVTPAGSGDFLADGTIPMTGSLYITEAAAASADSAGLGQIWVKNATPNELWFTDDAGTDFQLGTSGAGDITSVWGDDTGDVSALTAAAGDTLDASNADSTVPWVVNATAAPTVEGQVIWESDADLLRIGDGASTLTVAMSGGAFHDGFSDFVANEHIDWTSDQGATDIHSGNIPDLSGIYEPAGVAVADITDASANGRSLISAANYAAMQGLLSIDDLITLSGVAEGSTHLATFTGSTITDNQTIKAALQLLETAVETKQAADADLTTYAGITPSADIQTFLGYANLAAIKAGLSVDDLVTLSGVADGEVHLSTFTGSTITDNQTVKAALQLLETAVETKQATVTEGSLTDSVIVSGDIKDGEVAAGDLAGTLDLSSKTITLPARTANQEHNWMVTFNPDDWYAIDHELCLVVKTRAALTITSIEVTCDANPTTELDWDLYFADAFIGMANATLIEPMNTTDGAASITSSFDDATVPAGKCVYISFGADPDDAITQVSVQITWDYD